MFLEIKQTGRRNVQWSKKIKKEADLFKLFSLSGRHSLWKSGYIVITFRDLLENIWDCGPGKETP